MYFVKRAVSLGIVCCVPRAVNKTVYNQKKKKSCGEGSIAIRNRLKVSYPLEPSGKGLRESLREAVVVAVAKVGADGEFQRYSRIRSVIPKKK